MTTDPRVWPYVHAKGAAPSPTPMIHWGRVGSWQRALARLNTAASRLCEQIVQPPYEIGIRVRRGIEEDDGTFALEVVPWRRSDPLTVLLSPRPQSFNTQFSASALIAIQKEGSSELHREGNYLVGKLESGRLGKDCPEGEPRPWSEARDEATVTAERLSRTIDLLAECLPDDDVLRPQ